MTEDGKGKNMEIIDDLLTKKPFGLEQNKKNELFLSSIKESLNHHYNHCDKYKKFLDGQGFNIDSISNLAGLPFLPVPIFKDTKLVTGEETRIKKIVKSSSTSSGRPSTIYLDLVTINRQRKALVSILSDFLGTEKKIFFIFDSQSTVLGKENVSSRASAIKGILPFAKSFHFLLDDNLELDPKTLKGSISLMSKNDGTKADGTKREVNVCFFGFTWLIYKTLQKIESDPGLLKQFTEQIRTIEGEKIVLHIGGWEKLKGFSISKEQFNQKIGSILQLDSTKILDFYGMTEQLGTVYPDCRYGYKHVPLYSELLIRNTHNLEVCRPGETGFIQLISPLANSYPGISIITDDLGEIKGVDDCKCGRLGTYFVFKKRAEKAEIKGCGDTLD